MGGGGYWLGGGWSCVSGGRPVWFVGSVCVFCVGGVRGEEKGGGGVKPAAGGKIGILRPLQASWGSLNIKTGFGATRSVGFRGQIGQPVGGDRWGAPWKKSTAGARRSPISATPLDARESEKCDYFFRAGLFFF